jgi:hypothetical protein
MPTNARAHEGWAFGVDHPQYPRVSTYKSILNHHHQRVSGANFATLPSRYFAVCSQSSQGSTEQLQIGKKTPVFAWFFDVLLFFALTE